VSAGIKPAPAEARVSYKAIYAYASGVAEPTMTGRSRR
jgi:hypothetical protein